MEYDLKNGCQIEQCEYLGDYGCLCGKNLCGHHLDNHECEKAKTKCDISS